LTLIYNYSGIQEYERSFFSKASAAHLRYGIAKQKMLYLINDYYNVKTFKIAAVFLPTIAYSLILIFPRIRSGQTFAIFEKSDFQSTAGNSRFIQEKSKYIYVGSEKCASTCHNNDEMGFQYNLWKESRHSKSYMSLSSKRALRYGKNAGLKGNPQKDPVCLKCHITGGVIDSSFFAATYKKDDGVTCESCHKREDNPTTYIPKEPDCLKCHENALHKTHRFKFEKECAKIAHARPEPKTKGV
jgi:hypothetical protein